MESAVLESRWEETFDFWVFWEMCERKIKEMRWKSTRKWEKTKKHQNSKKKLGFVIRQYQFLSMRLRDEENTPWPRETKSRREQRALIERDKETQTKKSRTAYSFVFLKFFSRVENFFWVFFIRGCEFKRIYILVTKLTTFLYIYFKGCVNYFEGT